MSFDKIYGPSTKANPLLIQTVNTDTSDGYRSLSRKPFR